jgi:hypothetical protein
MTIRPTSAPSLPPARFVGQEQYVLGTEEVATGTREVAVRKPVEVAMLEVAVGTEQVVAGYVRPAVARAAAPLTLDGSELIAAHGALRRADAAPLAPASAGEGLGTVAEGVAALLRSSDFRALEKGDSAVDAAARRVVEHIDQVLKRIEAASRRQAEAAAQHAPPPLASPFPRSGARPTASVLEIPPGRALSFWV